MMKINNPQPDIIPCPDMSLLEDPVLSQLVENERELWGHDGYKEYVVCQNRDCRTLQSIEDVYGERADKPLAELEKNGPEIPNCPTCSSPCEIFFEPEIFVMYMRDYLSKGFFGALLMDKEGGLMGHTIAMRGIRCQVMGLLNYRQSYGTEICLKRMSEQLGENPIDAEGAKSTIFVSRIGIDSSLRGQGFYAKLTKAMLDIHPEFDGLPIVLETRFDTNAYPLLKALGYIETQTDQHENVLMVHKNAKAMSVREILSLPKAQFKERYGAQFENNRVERECYIKERQTTKKPRRYIGMPSLREALLTKQSS